MNELFKPTEKCLDDSTVMRGGGTYMIDGFAVKCLYHNFTVLDFKRLTHAREIRNCDVMARRKDFNGGEPEQKPPIVVRRELGRMRIIDRVENARALSIAPVQPPVQPPAKVHTTEVTAKVRPVEKPRSLPAFHPTGNEVPTALEAAMFRAIRK